jgi:type IV pilus assembly protein PilY1
MKTSRIFKSLRVTVLIIWVLAAPARASITDIASTPMGTSRTVVAKPNILLMLDDSGSMGWNYLPDWANDNSPPNELTQNNGFNGVYYNAATYYAPPSYFHSNTSSFTVSGSSSTTISSITVGGQEIMSGTSTGSSSSSTVATNIAAKINACTNVLSGNCAVTGYVASISGSTLTISAPVDNITSTPVITKSGSMTMTPSAFPGDGGTTDTITYPSQTSANTSAWTVVPDDGFGVQSTSDSNLVGNAQFYTFIPGEYCATPHLRSCIAASAPSTSYPYPATLRWCSDTALTTCQATWSSTYSNRRYAGKVITAGTRATATFTVGSSGSTSVSGITVNGFQIMSTASTANTSTSTVATNIRAQINACTSALAGACTIMGYSASGSSSTVIISAPVSLGNITYTASISKVTGGTMTMTNPTFSGGVNQVAIPGSNIYTSIVSGNNSYPYPGSTTKAAKRIDCAGTTCTYAEEMTNYANWWAYYQTRMQMMKSSASTAFSSLTSGYRVSYSTINNNTKSDFINFAPFTTAQKKAWYDKLFAAKPGPSTPLRAALTEAGMLYAGKYDGTNYNGSTVVDPMEYSCQQNFTILSTDGYWNESDPGGYKIDGTTAVGNQDGNEVRPMLDGSTSINTITTPYTTVKTTTTTTTGTITIPWTRTQTVIANCTTPGTPSNTATAPMLDGSNSVALGTTTGATASTNPDSNSMCVSIGAHTSTHYTWFCRGIGQGNNPVVNSSSVIDSNNVTWYLVSSGANTGTNCVANRTQWGGSYSNTKGICPGGTATPGSTIATTPQTQSETLTGGSISTVKTETATNQTTTQTISNGVAGTAGALTPANASATYTVTSNVVSFTGTPTTDTCSSQNGLITPCPNLAGTWTSGSTTTSACTAPALTAGTSLSTPSSGTPTGGTSSAGTPSYVSTAGTPTSVISTSGGTSNTLADVAEYYYVTDLRTTALSNCIGATGNDVCTNDVPTSTADSEKWQHMSTFTLGLGASGYMLYQSDYATAASGDFYDVKMGSAANTSTGICSWQATNGTVCNWPTPASNTQTTIDDLWHAAVNGRGVYFSASNPDTLATSLNSALGNIVKRNTTSAASTASNPNVGSGDNFVFTSSFTSSEWTGELIRQQIDITTGAISSTPDWKAQAALDTLAATTAKAASRTLYTYSASASNHLQEFNETNFGADSKFNAAHIAGLSQFCVTGTNCLSSTTQAAAAGAPLVNFLRGDQSNEDDSTHTGNYYRQRTHILGDLVNAEVAYVKQPLYTYADTHFADYATAQASRNGMVYAAANDGMLHAFNAGGATVTAGDGAGVEAWAYIPSWVLPNLYLLADKNYATQHHYFVDGSPVSGDICPNAPASSCAASQWKTILVGGLNLGGRGYYALDVTDPVNPKALWEFTDTNMGYTFGNPQITKLADGTWAVLVTSGYNNVPNTDGAGGDGVGRLYVLNANTGALIRSISTGVGSVGTPSGLARITARVLDMSTDNSAVAVYGGDMLGNLWRFDINNNVGATSPAYDAQLLATVKDASGNVQPITTKPEIGVISNQLIIYAGTGSYLGTSDLSSTQVQTMYAVKDTLSTTTTPSTAIYNNPRAATCATAAATGCFVKQTATNTTCPSGSPATICTNSDLVRTATSNSVDLSIQSGWYIDFPDSGERDNTDPVLAIGILGFTTNTLSSVSACSSAGYSYRWFLDYKTGAPLSTSTTAIVSSKIGDLISSGTKYVLDNNAVVELPHAPGGTSAIVPIGSGATAGATTGTRRTSWRELIQP